MKKYLFVAIGLFVLVGLGIWFYTTRFEANTNASGQPVSDNSAISVKTYTNSEYGYTFTYPSDWSLEPERSITEAPNALLSIIEVRAPDASEPHTFSVTVNRNEDLKKIDAGTAAVTVAGNAETAYLFPQGYECRMADPEEQDCSFFLIPIYRDGVWYELRGFNDAITLDSYQGILNSFRFTK